MKPNIGSTAPSREETLQKIIKNQDFLIKDLENKLSLKDSSFGPQRAHYESEIDQRDKEIEVLKRTIQDIQSKFNQENNLLTDFAEKSKKTIENLNGMLNKEKKENEKRIVAIEENLRAKIVSLENENRIYLEELDRLKNNYYKETDEKFTLQISENLKLLDDLKKINDIYMSKENEYRRIIETLKGELEENLDTFNKHLYGCRQEKKQLSKKYLEELSVINPEANEFKQIVAEFKKQVEDFGLQVQEKTLEIEVLKKQMDSKDEEYQQEIDNLKRLLMDESEYKSERQRELEKSAEQKWAVEREELQLTLKEKEMIINNLNSEIEALRIEAQLMEKNLDDIKTIASERELNNLNELQSLKINNAKLLEISEKREKIIGEELEIHRDEINKMHYSYQKREEIYQEEIKKLMEEVQNMHKMIEDLSFKQIEFYTKDEKEKRSKTPGKTTKPLNARERAERNQEKENLKKDFKQLITRDGEKEKVKESELARHRNELSHLQSLWEKALTTLGSSMQTIIELQSTCKAVSGKLEHLNNVAFPISDLGLVLSKEIEDMFTIVSEYQKIHGDYEKRIKHEVEIQKYEDKIVKLYQELELAKVSLVHYIQTTETLENVVKSMAERTEGNFQNEEVLTLKQEIKRLQDQNSILNTNKKKTEEFHQNQIANLTQLLTKRGDTDIKLQEKINQIIKVLEEIRDPLKDRESERLNLSKNISDMRDQVRAIEGMSKGLRSLLSDKDKFKDRGLDTFLKQIENEEIFLMRNQMGRLEERLLDIKNNVENERNFLQERANKLYQFESNPLHLYEELTDVIRKEQEMIDRIMDRLDKIDATQDLLISDIQASMNMTVDMRKQNDALNDAETIQILKAELFAMKEEAQREKEMTDNEIKSLRENFRQSYELLQKKASSATKLAEDMAKKNDELHDFNDKLKIYYEEKFKEIASDFGKKYRYSKEKLDLIVRENQKLKNEIGYWKDVIKPHEEEILGRYTFCLERLEGNVDFIEKLLIERKNLAAQELAKRDKMEDQFVKETLGLYELLQQQIASLKDQLDHTEKIRVQEKSGLINFMDNFKAALEQFKDSTSEDRDKLEQEKGFYKRIIKEKELQHEKDLKTLKLKLTRAVENE